MVLKLKFKLLGVTLDSKLIFSSYVSSICGRVNGILYSIKTAVLSPVSKSQFHDCNTGKKRKK